MNRVNAALADSLLCALPASVSASARPWAASRVCSWSCCLIGERNQLVGGLARLKRTNGALRGVDEAGKLDRVVLHGLNDLRLDHHGLLKGIACGLPSRLRIADEFEERRGRAVLLWIVLLKKSFDSLDIEAERLGSVHQGRDFLKIGGDRAQLREVQAGEVARHVLQHDRLILERLDLVIDLLKSPRRLKDILGEVRGVDHSQLRGRGRRDQDGRCRKCSGDQRRSHEADFHGVAPSVWTGKSASSAAAHSSPLASRNR